MGLSPSKRVATKLTNSSEFNSATDSVYNHCLSLTQHAFKGVLPHQLPTATSLLHNRLRSLPLVSKWVPFPPSRSQIDAALRRTKTTPNEEAVLGFVEFKAFAVELFSEAAVASARSAVVRRVPVGVGGIVAVGVVSGSPRGLVGSAVGAYALGVVTWVYLGLCG